MTDEDILGCLGLILGIYVYDSYDQQNDFIESLISSGTHVPTDYIVSPCPQETLCETRDWLIKVMQEKLHKL